MPKDEMDPEEFLKKLDELKSKLSADEYRELERQIPFGLVEHAKSVHKRREKKRWVGGILFALIAIVLVWRFPWLGYVWVAFWLVFYVVLPFLAWLADLVKPPRLS